MLFYEQYEKIWNKKKLEKKINKDQEPDLQNFEKNYKVQLLDMMPLVGIASTAEKTNTLMFVCNVFCASIIFTLGIAALHDSNHVYFCKPNDTFNMLGIFLATFCAGVMHKIAHA